MDIQAMTESFFRQNGTPGQIRILNHLTSDKGKAMNGRRCVVVGMDPPSTTITNRRIHVRLLDPNDSSKPVGKVLQIKIRNLADPRNYSSINPEPTLSKEVTDQFLTRAHSNGKKQGYDQHGSPDAVRDRIMRMNRIQQYFSGEIVDHDALKSKCMDPLMPVEQLNEFEAIKFAMAPACAGDSYVDFRRFGEGFVTKGHDMECVICQEEIEDDLIRLPCNHRFHLGCVKAWVEKENTCPTCRQALKYSLDTYIFPDFQRQIQNRFEEWFISGMCERCQAALLEDDPIVTVTREDGIEVTMPLSAANRYGYTEHRSVQGEAMNNVNILSEEYH